MAACNRLLALLGEPSRRRSTISLAGFDLIARSRDFSFGGRFAEVDEASELDIRCFGAQCRRLFLSLSGKGAKTIAPG